MLYSKFAFFSLLILFCWQYVASEDALKCAKDEETGCTGDCEATCAEPNKKCVIKKDNCKKGCVCRQGYVRRRPGQPCIQSEWCKNINKYTGDCRENEIVMACKIPCELNCFSTGPEMCHIKNCQPACGCKPGFLRKDNSTESPCISPKECNNNIVSVESNTDYEDMIDLPVENITTPTETTERVTVKPNVNINVNDTNNVNINNNEVFDLFEFNENCGNNEVFKTCSNNCNNMCPGHQSHFHCFDNENLCTKGCFCKDNFYLDNQIGECVSPDHCTKVCTGNEIFKKCGSRCSETCKNNNNKTCDDFCTSGCFCQDNYLRDATTGRCIPENECKIDGCEAKDNNSYYSECITCPKTCKNANSEEEKCTENCKTGCACKKEFYLDQSCGKCVLLEECPGKTVEEATVKPKKVEFNFSGYIKYSRKHGKGKKREHLSKKHNKHNKNHEGHNKN